MGIRSVFTYFYTGGLHHESPSSDRTDFSFGHALCHCRKCVLAVQLNGVLIMVIGAGMAILFNLWMPNKKPKLKKGIKEIEENFRVVLELINQRLLENDFDIPLIRAEVEHVDKSIEDFRQLALS